MRLPIIGVSLGVLLTVFVALFGSDTKVVIDTTHATPPALIETVPATLPVTLPSLTASTSATVATSTPKAPSKSPAAPTKQPAAPSTAPAVAAPPAAQQPPAASGSIEATAGVLRGAIVNILCYTSAGSALKPISGSGVIIDSRGIILTAAHVAQYFLLHDYPASNSVSCVIRTGSPAHDAYYASLAYISTPWVSNNLDTLTAQLAYGTGENDFALLAITGSATGAPLPNFFPALPLSHTEPQIGDPIVIGSYGAQFLESSAIESSLFSTLVYGSIKDRFTFNTDTVDVVSLGGTAAAQEGSSGGGVANSSTEITGLITTSTIQGDTSTRDLRGITPRHIRASYMQDTGRDLDSYLATHSLSQLVTDFAPRAATLTALLLTHLPH